jgi:hypothetical protein
LNEAFTVGNALFHCLLGRMGRRGVKWSV